jgi:hypothetical protein
MTKLATLLSVAEDAPGCGTKWPGWRPHPVPHFEAGPSPEPWRAAEAFVAMHTAIRVAQSGTAVGGKMGEQMSSLATAIFDDGCGNVPWRDLLYWLLHHPPPPPPYYLQEMLTAASLVTTGKLSGGELGRGLEQVGIAQVSRSLELANSAIKQAGNIAG